jgi:hypothetical protein
MRALDLVLIIGPKEAADGALDASKDLHAWAFTAGSSRQQAVDAVDEFQSLARRLLKHGSCLRADAALAWSPVRGGMPHPLRL